MESPNKSRKIRNPFAPLPGYNCFGCSPSNPIGLQMTFHDRGEEVVSEWDPQVHYQGFYNILHGGIQATLMDEIASWVVYVKLKTAGFTSKAEIRYRKNVYVNKGNLSLTARLLQMRRNLADIEVNLFDHERTLCASGLFTYFTFTQEKAREKMFYPEYRHFFEEDDLPAPATPSASGNL